MKGSGISFAKRGKRARGLTPSVDGEPIAAAKLEAKRRPEPVTPEHADPQARRNSAFEASMLIPTPPTLGPREPGSVDGAGGDEFEGWDLDGPLFPPCEEDDLLAAAEAELTSSGASSRTMVGQGVSQPAFFEEEFFQTTQGMLIFPEKEEEEHDDPEAPSTPTPTLALSPSPEADARSQAVAHRAAPHETPACIMRFEAMSLHPSRTFFRIAELLQSHAREDRSFELFARVAHSGRENFGHRQYFHLCDLLAATSTAAAPEDDDDDDAPAVPGLLAGWKDGGAVDRAAQEFLAPLARGQLGRKCYLVGELRGDLVEDDNGGGAGGWAVLVREIRPVLWRDVRGAMEVLGRDDLDRWVC